MRSLITFFIAWCCLLPVGCEDKTTAPPPPPTPPDGPVIYVPDEASTLAEALQYAEDGDTIMLAEGVYLGDGNRDITIPNLGLVIMSESGASATIIDCEGGFDNPHYALSFDNVDSSVVAVGLTIRGAYGTHGAVRCRSSSPTFEDCIFVDNHATVSGGALRFKSGAPHLEHCTITGNSSITGGGMFLIAGASPTLTNCIISFSGDGGAVYSSDGTSVPSLSCCDIFGNEGGDWVGRISDQAGSNGNFSADPLFCDPNNGDLRLQENSPCAPENNDCGELIGAGAVDCD